MAHIFSRTLLGLSILASASAFAADGYVTGNVYLRAGPDSSYPSVAMLDAGTPVAIEGCVDGWSWCDVDAGGNRGWAAGDFLQDDYRGQRMLVPQYGVQIGHSDHQLRVRNVLAGPLPRPFVVFPTRALEPGAASVPDRGRARDSRGSNYGNSRGTPRAYASHNAAVVTAPARSAHETQRGRAATPQRPAVANAEAYANHSSRPLPAVHSAASPRTVVQHPSAQSRVTAQRQAARPRAAAQRGAARPEAQQKKPPHKSNSDKNKRRDSSGQH